MPARFSILLLFLSHSAFASHINDSTEATNGIFLKGYADIFYAYDFNKPSGETRLPFLTNHNRHNSIQPNWAYLHAGIEKPRYRANVALQAGTYVTDNYASEPLLMRNIYQANAGFAPFRRREIWIDAGIFPSHIGFESTISFENSTLSRSFVAETTPYYLSGVKVSGQPDSSWSWQIILCNGWQRIQMIPGNSLLSAGTRLTYKTASGISFNWSTFLGTDDPDSTRRMRFLNNFYGFFPLGKKVELMAGLDIGIQQREKKSDAYHHWYSPVIILKYKITEKWAAAFRSEYFDDSKSIIIPSVSKSGFRARSASLNVDFSHSDHLLWRLECRWMNSSYNLFPAQGRFVRDNVCLLGSISVRFGDQ